MGVVKAAEHFLFRNYSKGIKEWLIENVYLSNYSEEENVTIVYSTPDRAWAKYIYPVVNGLTMSPNINFVLTGIEYIEGENILGFVREYVPTDDGKIKAVKPPLIYKLTYTANIYTRVQSEMDILLYQLLTGAHKNAKAVLSVDGQWAELHATNERTETNLEPGETQDKTIRHGIDLVIQRAYLPFDIDIHNMINNVEFEFDI